MNQEESRRWQMLTITGVIVFLIWLLAPVLMPFAIAAMLAYLGDPLAHRLQRLGLGRTLAVTIVFIVLLVLIGLALLLLVPLIVRQVENLVQNFPRYLAWAQDVALPWLQTKLHLDPNAFDSDRIMAAIKEHLGTLGDVLGKLSRSSVGVLMWMTNLVLIPVVWFYLLRDWDRLVGYIDRMLPRSIQPTVAYLARESDLVLGAFVRGQLLVMAALGVYYGVALTLIGLSVGPLIGMVAGLLSFVPYLGFITGFASAIIAALVLHGDWTHVLLVVGVFTIGQLLEGYVLVPRLVGEKIGLHPVAVIFAVLAGGYLFGFLGVLLALPAASVILVLLRYLSQRYRNSDLYTEEGPGDAVLAEVDIKISEDEDGHIETETHIEQAKDSKPKP